MSCRRSGYAFAQSDVVLDTHPSNIVSPMSHQIPPPSFLNACESSIIMASPSINSIHRPLKGSEIRLIRIKSGALDGPLICDVDYVPLDIPPPYFALSYVWGDEKDTRLATLNGHPFRVTVNLYDALQRLREWHTRPWRLAISQQPPCLPNRPALEYSFSRA